MPSPPCAGDERRAITDHETRSRAYAIADTVWNTFTEQLLDPASHGVGLRDRYAAMGAAQALLLDRLLPGWHARVLAGSEAVEDVLRDALDRTAPTRRARPEAPPAPAPCLSCVISGTYRSTRRARRNVLTSGPCR